MCIVADNTGLVRRALRSYALYVVVGVVVGAIAAPVVAVGFSGGDSEPGPDGTVAVVTLAGTIDGATAAKVTGALERARDDPSVEAVVLVINSGGGSAAASEQLYLSVRRTAAEMPVVASIDASAASGAYYAAAPADRIVVKPASTVGSIGVLAELPQTVEPNQIVGASGPNKLAGSDVREFLYIIESLQRAFVGAVVDNRGDEIELTRSQIEQARVYSGGQAVENGLADQLGDRTTAARVAAAEAELERYRLRQLQTTNGTTRFLSRDAYLASETDQGTVVDGEYLLGDGPTFLMVSGLYLSDTDRTVSAQRVPSPDAVNATGTAQTTGETSGTNETTTEKTGTRTDEIPADEIGTTDDVAPAQPVDRREPVRPAPVAPGGGVA
jgi:protease-4